MSLLGKQVYANPTTPLWGSGQGGSTFTDITVISNATVGGDVNVTGEVTSVDSLRIVDSNAATKFSLANDFAGNSLIQSTDVIKFTQLGTPNGNTQLTLSAVGANADNFNLGGVLYASIGPVPTQVITSTKTVNPVSISPSGPDAFGVDTTITSISNAEYDVQMTGTVFVASGTIDASDYVVMNAVTSGGSGTVGAIVFPSELLLGANYVSGIGPLTAGGAAANVNLRSRITATASGTTLGANVRAFSPNASTAVYGANLTVLDVQRVR